MIISGTVKDGRLEFLDEDKIRYANYVARAGEGTVLRIELERLKATRSQNQNRYYWGVVIEPLRQYLGIETAELMHEVLKHEHLSVSVRLAFDRRKRIKVARSTSELTTAEFEDYLGRIREWSRKKLNFRIPLPNESPYPYEHDERE